MSVITKRLGAILLGLCLAATTAAATFNIFQPATGVLKGNANTPVTTAATSADLLALFSGTCDMTTFVRGDGACASAAITGQALTRTNDTNVTLTLGGSPTTALVNATSITAGWTGTLAASRGGTGVATLGDLTRTNDTNVTLTLGGTPVGSLINNTSLTLGWTGTLAASRGGTGVASLGTLTKADDTNVTLTLGGTPTGALINAASITAGWTGTLAASRGGLGMSTVTDDTLAVANGSTWESKALANCTDTAGNHLNYTASTNAFSCGTSTSGSTVTPAALTKTDDTNVTLTLGGTPSTALLQASSITAGWTGTLAASRGGTANGFTAFSGPATSTKTFTLPNASATVLTDNAAVTVAQGGTGAATLTGYVKGSGTSAMTASATIPYSDLTGTPTIPTGANPSASLGLSAVNGSASTFMRSDGAPALSQSIAPTWTGLHLFSSALSNPTIWDSSAGNGVYVTFRRSATALADVGNSAQVFSGGTLDNFGIGTRSTQGLDLGTNSLVRMTIGSGGSVTSTGVHLGPDGSAGAPTYSFSGDTDTGLDRPGTNRLDVVTAGASHLAINDNGGVPAIDVQKGVFRITDGTAGTPSLSFGNDTDTGSYRVGANSYGIATGGANRVTVGPGVQVGAPTGGDQGAGTVNATGLYINGTAVDAGSEIVGTFTGTLTGMTASPTCSMKYRKVGNMVTLYVASGSCSGTSNATTFTMTGIPAAIQTALPQAPLAGTCLDNGTGLLAGCLVQYTAASGTITFCLAKANLTTGIITYDGSGWTSANSKGLNNNFVIQYQTGN